jgi:hypothetical protein
MPLRRTGSLFLVLLVGCSSSTPFLRVEADEDSSVVHIPRGYRAPVELDEGAFMGAVAKLAPQVPLFSEPLQEARRLLIAPSRGAALSRARGHLGFVSSGSTQDVPRVHLLQVPPDTD